MNSKSSDVSPDTRAKPVRYLSAEELYNINYEVTEGETTVRDANLLISAVARPKTAFFGQVQYPTLIDKAAALLESLAYHHLFEDGNKRTAVRAVKLFLELNDHTVTWDFVNEYPFILEVAQGKHDTDSIATWLAGYVQPKANS
jgi:death-on-curing protein